MTRSHRSHHQAAAPRQTPSERSERRVRPTGERAADVEVGRVVGHLDADGIVERRQHPRLPDDLATVAPLSSDEVVTALDAVSDPLFIVDRHWRVRYLNAAARRATSMNDAVGAVLWRVRRPLTTGALYERLREAMRDRRAVTADAYATADAGWTTVSAYPVDDGLLVVHHTVDEADAASWVRPHDAARAKSQFLATMSHELRTPINAITGYTQLLELGVAGPVTAMQRAYLDRLANSSRHLLALVDDVLDLSTDERGRLSIAREVRTTGPAVATSLAIVAPDAAARSIRLVDERARDAGLPFVGDEHRVRQILVNLLSNAIKFTPPGGTVTVRADRRSEPEGSEWVALSVRDTGIGISAAQHGAIFDAFMQADGSRTRSVGGAGLGLALSRRLARLMGGDLIVDSAEGQGSTFTLLLPTAGALPSPAQSMDAPPPPPTGPPPRSPRSRHGSGER